MRIVRIVPFLAIAGCPRAPSPAKIDASRAVSMILLPASGEATYCPHGHPSVIGARVTMDDGRVFDSWTPGDGIGGRLEVKAFEWTTSWGAVDAEARLQLPYD